MKIHRKHPPNVVKELASVLAGLEVEERAKIEALFETALNASQERTVIELWDQPELSASYWILMVSSIAEVEGAVSESLLRWKAFFAKHSATVLCVQSSEREAFHCCMETFKVRSFPTLVFGATREMEEHICFGPHVLSSLAQHHGAFHRFVTQLQGTIESGCTLAEIADEVCDARFWRNLNVAMPDTREISVTKSDERQFDVFLSHNSKDKPTVRRLAKALKQRGVRVWLDEWELQPGRPWQEEIEAVIETVGAAAVLVGGDGLGPWELPEMRGCLAEFVRRGLPVIPVLLPGAPTSPELPLFLRQFTWVDLRDGLTKDRISRLTVGINGSDKCITPNKAVNPSGGSGVF